MSGLNPRVRRSWKDEASSVLDQSDAAMSLPEEAWAQDDDGPPRHFGFIAKDKVLSDCSRSNTQNRMAAMCNFG